MRIFRSRIQQGLSDGTPIATFIDEVSMLTPICLGQILGRYQHPDLKDFKQGAFILVGDMWQVYFVKQSFLPFSLVLHSFSHCNSSHFFISFFHRFALWLANPFSKLWWNQYLRLLQLGLLSFLQLNCSNLLKFSIWLNNSAPCTQCIMLTLLQSQK